MAADIFISYSSKDRDQAEQLTELLASAGLSVWIDRAGIHAATQWSGEIVDAINECKVFVLLLSQNSIDSHNVIKEVSLASEKRKKILPLDIEPVALTRDFEYQLAGIQRAPIGNIDAVLRALEKLGFAAKRAPSIQLVKEKDSRKSLMILPFEDLSPTGDNAWFADGLATELINSLSPLKALRVSDHQATKDYKRYQGTLPTYAREMSIRYFIQGQVRKFGDQIKISITLLDIETGDHLWQDSMKGTMNDIFDIQEKVAENVVEGLKVHLASEEKKKLAERETENAEAYELSHKASEYFDRQTKEGLQLAIQLYSEAIKLDPAYAIVYSGKANALATMYRSYNRDPALLEEGLHLIREALRLKPDLWAGYHPLSIILQLQGKLEEAEETAKEYIRKTPGQSTGHFSLGFFYQSIGQPAKAIGSYEASLKLKPENVDALFNLVAACSAAKEIEKQKYWSGVAIPLVEKHLKLFPDDEDKRVHHAMLLHFADRDEEARIAARNLENLKDGVALFNTACLQCLLKDYGVGIKTFRRSIDAGLRNMPALFGFLNDEEDGIGRLKGTPEYEDVQEIVSELNREQTVKASA